MGKTAETVIVLSFAYFSQFPPQFSPCENCALIVQTTLWHFSSLVPPLPLQNKFFYLHYARSSIHSCGNFRCSLIRVLLAVSAAVFAAKTAHSLFKQRYGILYPLFRLPLQNKFSTYIMFAPLSTAAETSAVLSFAYLSQFPPQFSPCENCLTVRSNNAMELHLPLFRLLLTEQVFYLHYARSSIHSG